MSREALFDELEKIAEDRKKKFKGWLTDTAIVSAGSGLAAGATALGAEAAKKALGQRWSTLTPKTQLMIAVPAYAAASFAGGYAAKKMYEELQRRGEEREK